MLQVNKTLLVDTLMVEKSFPKPVMFALSHNYVVIELAESLLLYVVFCSSIANYLVIYKDKERLDYIRRCRRIYFTVFGG